MSAKTVQPKNSRSSARRAKTGILDILVVAAGFALIAVIGWVAYRTQVLGEPVAKVLPFLAHREPLPAASPGGPPASGSPSDGAAPSTTRDPGAKPGASPDDPADTTYFGRRISPSSR